MDYFVINFLYNLFFFSYELLYRRCSEEEVNAILHNKGLTLEQIVFFRKGRKNKSEPLKWLSSLDDFVQGYQPKNTEPKLYSHVVVFYVEPGTIDALNLERLEGIVRRGPRGALVFLLI